MNTHRLMFSRCMLGALGLVFVASVPVAHAQVWAIEGMPWQFDSSADKANKAMNVDLMERKKGGYYDSFQTTNYITNTTNIKRQYNCGVTANATGSAADSSQGSTVSSPVTTNTSGNYLSSTGNTSSTGAVGNGAGGRSGTPAGSASVGTDQSNTGSVSAGVRGSPSDARSGQIHAGGGTNSQSLNVNQSNTGTQTASLSGSTGCDFASGGVALN